MKTNRFLDETSGRLVILFGKYTGEYLEDVAREDPRYLRYVLSEFQNLPDEVADVIEKALDPE